MGFHRQAAPTKVNLKRRVQRAQEAAEQAMRTVQQLYDEEACDIDRIDGRRFTATQLAQACGILEAVSGDIASRTW